MSRPGLCPEARLPKEGRSSHGCSSGRGEGAKAKVRNPQQETKVSKEQTSKEQGWSVREEIRKEQGRGGQERKQFKKEKVKRVKTVKRSSETGPEVPMKLVPRRAGLESSFGWEETQPTAVHSPV